MQRRRELKERVSKTFLLSLLEPFLPILKEGEKITDLAIKSNLDTFDFTYIIMGGGANNNAQLREGEQVGGHASPSTPKRSPKPGTKKSP